MLTEVYNSLNDRECHVYLVNGVKLKGTVLSETGKEYIVICDEFGKKMVVFNHAITTIKGI